MGMKNRFVVALLIPTLLLSGCAGMNKQEQGTAIGAIVGGAAGIFFGRGTGKIIAVLAGAAIGGLIGNRIGNMLDEQDKIALQAQAQKALARSDGESVQWNSDHSNATAVIVPTNTRMEERSVTVIRSSDVAAPATLDIISANWEVKKDAPVHLAPEVDSKVIMTLPEKSRIWAVGKTEGGEWVMVAQNGKSIGYVNAKTVAPVPVKSTVTEKPASKTKKPVAAAKPAATTTAKKTEESFNLDDAPVVASSADTGFDLDSDAPVRTVADLDALGPDLAVNTVVASVSCRDIQTSVTAGGVTENDSSTVCKTPDGSWVFD